MAGHPPPPPSLTFSGDTSESSDRPLTPSTTSNFSFATTMENSVFRDDAGSKYQATNDEYSAGLSSCKLEVQGCWAYFRGRGSCLQRLDIQHRGFKAMQGGKNYLAPIDEVLRAGGESDEEQRVLDIGTGSGNWAIDMAFEFPHVQVTGTDLAPVQLQHHIQVPENCHFAHEDAAGGLSYPDNHFDVVHLRALVAGIQDWASLIDDIIRILKPGGLIVSVEACEVFRLADDQSSQSDTKYPGYVAFCNYVDKALEIRGLQPHAGRDVIPDLLQAHKLARDVGVKPMHVPLTPWSKDLLCNKVGEIMVPDTKAIPDTLNLLISDACGLSAAQYEEVKAGYMKDLFENGAHGIISLAHIWAFKV